MIEKEVLGIAFSYIIHRGAKQMEIPYFNNSGNYGLVTEESRK
jgi:hypothetical protein